MGHSYPIMNPNEISAGMDRYTDKLFDEQSRAEDKADALVLESAQEILNDPQRLDEAIVEAQSTFDGIKTWHSLLDAFMAEQDGSADELREFFSDAATAAAELKEGNR